MQTFLEAEAYEGPSIIIAYAHCISHGIDTANGHEEQRNAVDGGYWPLYRYNPALREQGKNPLIIDSKRKDVTFEDFASKQNRFKLLGRVNAEQ